MHVLPILLGDIEADARRYEAMARALDTQVADVDEDLRAQMVVTRRDVDDGAWLAALLIVVRRGLAFLDVRDDIVDDGTDVLMGIAMRPLRHIVKILCTSIHSIHGKSSSFSLLSQRYPVDQVIVKPQYTSRKAKQRLASPQCTQASFTSTCTYADFLSETSVKLPSIVKVSTIAPRMT